MMLRTLGALCGCFLLIVLTGPQWIAWLRARFREPIKCDSVEIRRLHQAKEATPTMGGLFLMAGILAAVFCFGDWQNPYLGIAVLLILGFSAVGILDDLVKLRRSANGLSATQKFLAELVVAVGIALILYAKLSANPQGLTMVLPWSLSTVSLGIGFVPLAIVVLLGSVNAVNITDGLDGLASGCLLPAIIAVSILAVVSGHAEWAESLHLPYVSGAGELIVLAGGMIGGLLGFLWFNGHPARVFMGDTGSLPLGGLLGYIALVARQELLLVLIAGVFVVEAVSVILQVEYFKWRKQRIFRCAPLHHHYQLKGWAENQIVVRFWIAAALCALLGVASLKCRVENERPVSRSSITKTTDVRPTDSSLS